MKSTFLWIACALTLNLVGFGSGTAKGEPPGSADAAHIEFFEKRVRPLLVEHCYECHSQEERSGGLLLDSRDGWQQGGDSGEALLPGNPQKSRVIEAVRYRNPNLQMPPAGKLPEADIAVLEQWIADGAVDPRENHPGPVSSSLGMSVEEGKAFWSFQPISPPPVPELEQVEWIRNPIDAFIAARLQTAGLQPAPAADRATLIRRMTFDMTGLPPTREEVAAFAADERPAAVERLVERLLASPQYGEHWGRHWLDVARYADSNGLDENLAYGNAWRYRDYVVNAFNSDKPFDEFLVEQLAGDLLPRADRESITATGFLALGAKVLAEPDREKLEMDTIDEQIDATGKAFLGMTLGCVRCHDHKFDPLLQRDYYALAGIFKSTKTFSDKRTGAIKHWNEHSFATEEEQQALKAVDEQIKEKNTAATTFKTKSMAEIRAAAVAQAAVYLAAAAHISPQSTLVEVEDVAGPLGLHARILRHCRLHLEYNPEDPLVLAWAKTVDESPDSSVAALTELFAPWFEVSEVSATPTAADESVDPSEEATDSDIASLAQAALKDTTGLITVPPQPEYALNETQLAEYYRLLEEARLLESGAPDETAVMAVREGTIHTSLPIHIRGSHNNLGEPVPRQFPTVMLVASRQPVMPRNESGRLELAQWLASSQHPLTARVYVNRVWRWHFGRGIVASTDNFGKLGDPPSHPELLDWLAYAFMERGWSTKELHRLILLSNTYQMSSVHPDEQIGSAKDPENQLLWKNRLQRLSAEQIRDAVLSVAGQLDSSMGGKTVPLRNRQFVFNHTSKDFTKYDSRRRAVYLPVIRNNLYTLFEQFDFPDPTTPTGSRNQTVVAPQALLMMNDTLIMDAATALAGKILQGYSQTAQRIDLAYQLALGRSATQEEILTVEDFLAAAAANIESQPSELESWSLFCQALIASNEFVYIQ